MATSKRTILTGRSAIARAGSRNPVTLAGRCRVGEGPDQPIEVIDLDAHGCNVRGISVAVTKSDALDVWLGAVGPIAARLTWAKRGAAGIVFDQPLNDADFAAAMEQSGAMRETSNVVPLGRRRAE